MSQGRGDQRRRWLPVGAVLVAAAIGLVTEAAGDALPPVDGHERLVWAVLGGLVVVAIIVDVAATGSAHARRHRLGHRVREYSFDDLEVHPPVAVPGRKLREQTDYVRRAHDDRLAATVSDAGGGASAMVTLVGDSSTGKTRACYEAVQVLPKRWRLWHPIDPSRPDAVLGSLNEVRPYTVVWINDAHHYLMTADPAVGEQVAAGLRSLLGDTRRAPVLVLATLWPEFWRQLTATPPDGQLDPHAQARALLTRTDITVPAAFTATDLAAVKAAAAHDPRLAMAVAEAEAGRITQYLAGVPELLSRYRTAPPDARAVLDAAIDARRLGHPVHLPVGFLHQAAAGYFSSADHTARRRQHGDAWFDRVVDDLDRPQRGIPGPLSRVRTNGLPSMRLADAVEAAGTTARATIFPPASFWNAAAATIIDAAALTALALQAERRGRYRRAVQLYIPAVNNGGGTRALRLLAGLLENAADHTALKQLIREAADGGNTWALRRLAHERYVAGDDIAVERILREAASRGDTEPLRDLVFYREKAGDDAAAEQLLREAAGLGDIVAMRELAYYRSRAGDDATAVQLLEEAAGRGSTWALQRLARWRRSVGDDVAAERLLREAAGLGDMESLRVLAFYREEAGDHATAEQLLREAASLGDGSALVSLVRLREKAGDDAAAEQLLREAVDRDDSYGLGELIRRRQAAGDDAVEQLLREVSERGHTTAMVELAIRRNAAGDDVAAEQLVREATDRGSPRALNTLALFRNESGDHVAAKQLRRFGLTDSGEPADSLEWR